MSFRSPIAAQECFGQFCRKIGNSQYRLEQSPSVLLFVCSIDLSIKLSQRTCPGCGPWQPSGLTLLGVFDRQDRAGANCREGSCRNRLSNFNMPFDDNFSCNSSRSAFLLCPRACQTFGFSASGVPLSISLEFWAYEFAAYPSWPTWGVCSSEGLVLWRASCAIQAWFFSFPSGQQKILLIWGDYFEW